MPTIKNWQDWDEDDEVPARSHKKQKPARFGEETEPKRTRTKRRQDKTELPSDIDWAQDEVARRGQTPAATVVPPKPSIIAPPAPPKPPIAQTSTVRPLSKAPAAPTELSPLQRIRAQRSGGNRSETDIYEQIKLGTPVNRVATALGMTPEMVEQTFKHQEAITNISRPAMQAVRLYEGGSDFQAIAAELKVSETEARALYARGHVQRYGADPAAQFGTGSGRSRRGGIPGKAFPAGVFEQPTFVSDANRNNPAISSLLLNLSVQVKAQGYELETTFEADAMGGRHVVRMVKDNETIGQPFRLTATPSGVPLISKTGKAPGGYRLTHQGRAVSLDDRLKDAALEMAANHKADKAKKQSGSAPSFDDDFAPDAPDWMNDAPFTDQGQGSFTTNFDEIAQEPDYFRDQPAHDMEMPADMARVGGNAKGPKNVLDLLNVKGKNGKEPKDTWKQISGSDFMRLTVGGRFREENSEALVLDEHGAKTYGGLEYGNYYPAQEPWMPRDPEAVPERALTPIVSKGTIYPLEARNYIPGNITTFGTSPSGSETESHWGSQKSIGKQVKRDELSLTRKYWQVGPALGTAYEQTPQHILGQRAEEPEMAYTARAFVLDRGGIIPEGQMWKDTNYAPWAFGSFDQFPEKYELRVDANYSDEEILGAAGLLGEDGNFKPRALKPGDKVLSPNGFAKDLIHNNEAAVISGHEIVETINEQGKKVKALRFKGFFGNRPNVVSAMKLEGWKNLSQDKHIREKLGIDADIITNKPSDPVVANISMLNAMHRADFEDLWHEVHGKNKPAPTRTATMADVEDLAPVWQRHQEKNRATEILHNQVVDADTRDSYLQAGIVKDNHFEELPPLFEGAEPTYRMDLIASGYYTPVRVNMVTDVTKLSRGHLSNEILRSVEFNHPGLGEHLRDQGYKGRDIYHTLFEMHQLNTQPGFTEHGSPVVDLIGDLTGNKDARANIESLYAQKLAEILPDSMAGLDPRHYTVEQTNTYKKLKSDAGVHAIRQHYDEAFGDDAYIFRLGDQKEASYMANPGMVERFGYTEEESNERLSKLKTEGEFQLKSVWEAVQSGNPGEISKLLKRLPARMEPIIKNQEELLQSAGARKKWFGTSDTSISTHVHASDYGLPRNATAMSWEDILKTAGLRDTRANRAYLTTLSRAGNLPYSGVRNPASDPIAQTATILNMLTPDILQAAGLDIPLTGHPQLYHPHHVQAQGGDNDSDQSQIYMVMKKVAGELTNAFGLRPSNPNEITSRAKEHAAGEYGDALKKLNILDPAELAKMSPDEQQQGLRRQIDINQMGFDPTAPTTELAGTSFSSPALSGRTLADHLTNSTQIGQTFNYPIRVGIGLTENPEAKKKVSQYGGWMYQNPLDKVNYEEGSPEADLFKFFTSYNAFTGSFGQSGRNPDGSGTYYSYRKKSGFENKGQFAGAGLLAIMKRLTEKRTGTQAQMTPQQAAGFMSRSTGDLEQKADFVQNSWNLPAWEQLNSKAILGLQVNDAQRRMLEGFATGDSPLAQMLRGYGVRNALKSTANLQRKLQVNAQDPLEQPDIEGMSQFAGNLRENVNVMQNEMYCYGTAAGSGSTAFKKDYKAFSDQYDIPNHNFFPILEPGGKNKARGEFWSWAPEKRRKFYEQVADLLKKHVTGYDVDAEGRFRNLDPQVSKNNPLLAEGFEDYDRIRDLMAVNARDRAEDETESYVPSLFELEQSEVTGGLVQEKFGRKQKQLGHLETLFGAYQQQTGADLADEAFESYLVGQMRYTPEEQAMFHQADMGHREAEAIRAKRKAIQDEPMFFGEGGVLDKPTKLGETPSGRAVVGGEAGREYVVPEDKTQDLGGGLKLFDTDALGDKAPSQAHIWPDGSYRDGRQGWAAVMTANFKGKEVTREIAGQGSGHGSEAMEYTGALEGLRAMKPGKSAKVFSDHQGLVAKMKGDPKKRKNNPLLTEIDRVIKERELAVEWQWVGGHMGKKHNERAHALAFNQSSEHPIEMAKGGIIDYEGYANAPTSDFETAMAQVAQELSGGGAFSGDLEAAKRLVGSRIEADIQKMAANPPTGAYKGLYATDITGRATDRMAQALGPDPAQADRSAWNDFLNDYGLSADFQPLGVSPAGVDAPTRTKLGASGVGMADFLKRISGQIAGKEFSHTNYGHVYDSIPGWGSFWKNNRPGPTRPTSTLTTTGQQNLTRLTTPAPIAVPTPALNGQAAAKSAMGAGLPPPPPPPPPSPVGPPMPIDPSGELSEPIPAGQLNEIVTVPKLTPQLMGEYRHTFDQMDELRHVDTYNTSKEQLAKLKLAGSRSADVFKIAQRSKSLLYQQKLVDMGKEGINPAQRGEYGRLIQTYGNADPDLINNERGFTDAERDELTTNIRKQNVTEPKTGKAETYLFGRMEELFRNQREKGLSLTDSQAKTHERMGLGYKALDPVQVKLAGEFDEWFQGQFPAMDAGIPLMNDQGDPTYLGGTHPNFDPAYIRKVLPQAREARLKYEQTQLFKGLTPQAVNQMHPAMAEVMERAENVPFASEQLKEQERTTKEHGEQVKFEALAEREWEKSQKTQRKEGIGQVAARLRLAALPDLQATLAEKRDQQERYDAAHFESLAGVGWEKSQAEQRKFGQSLETTASKKEIAAERQALRMGQIDRRLGDVREIYGASASGRGEAFSQSMPKLEDALDVSFLSSQRQSAFEAAVPLKQKYDQALKQGDLGQAQKLFDQMTPLNTFIGELKDQIGLLTPHIKEHIDKLSEQTAVIRDDLKERKSTYGALAAKEKQLQVERVGMTGAERTAKDSQISLVSREIDATKAGMKGQAKRLGQLSLEKEMLSDLTHEPQGRSISGLGSRPQTQGQQAMNELRKGYDPQRMFWQFQNMQQLQFMAFMPMLKTRDQYLGEQSAVGQAGFALGSGGMPASVLSAQASQANMSRAQSTFGRGVDNSIAMNAWKGFTNFLGQNEGAGGMLGAVGFDATSALAATMGVKMVGGPAMSALSKLTGIGQAGQPVSMTAPGGLTRASMGTAALGGGGLLAGGLGLIAGMAGYEALRDEQSASLPEVATVASYGLGGLLGGLKRAVTPGTPAMSFSDLWSQPAAERAGTATGKYTGAVTEPDPAWLTRMEEAVAKKMGVGKDELPFDKAELAQMIQMAAEDQGLTKQQLEGDQGVIGKLADDITSSYKSGVSMQQSSSIRQKAIEVSGYAPGTEGATMMSDWIKQGSLFQQQQRYGAAQMVQGLAETMDFTPQQRQEMSQNVYRMLSDGISQVDVGRQVQQRSMSNQYYFSAAAYDSGQSQMAIMDQAKPWMPKNQEAQWGIEDRRRGEDNARELGQGDRQETEIGWQGQKLELEQKFWDFRRKSQVDDFAMQQKMFDFNIRQQRMALEWEDKQSRSQKTNYESQYALNKKIFELQTKWQYQDFDKQESRMDTGRDWQLEDSAWNRESFNIQSGWQSEDLQRSLRYASSGRERMDIRRQIERSSTMNERKITEFDRQDSRDTTQYDWAKEDLQTQRDRFTEMNELQRQQMELGRSFWLEQQSMAESYREARRAAMEEQIALQQEQNALGVQQFNDGFLLAEEQHALETQINETKQAWAVADLALARERSKEDETILALQRETATAGYFYAYFQTMGYDAAVKAKPELESMAKSASSLADDMERYARALAGVPTGIPTNAPNSSEAMFPGGSVPGMTVPNFTPAPPGNYQNGPMTPGPALSGQSSPLRAMSMMSQPSGAPGEALALQPPASGGGDDAVLLLAAILAQMQEGGGTILINEERLRQAGFLHQSNFTDVYR